MNDLLRLRDKGNTVLVIFSGGGRVELAQVLVESRQRGDGAR